MSEGVDWLAFGDVEDDDEEFSLSAKCTIARVHGQLRYYRGTGRRVEARIMSDQCRMRARELTARVPMALTFPNLALGEAVSSGTRHSIVREAVHVRTGRIVAVRSVYVPSLSVQRKWPELCERLARVAARPCEAFVELHDVHVEESDAGALHLVMEHMDRGNLRSYMCGARARTGSDGLHEPELCHIASQLLYALESLHAAGGALNPSLDMAAVLLAADGRVKISQVAIPHDDVFGMDFRHFPTLEDVQCSAPERLTGRQSDSSAAADIWGFGVLLVHCVMGKSAYDATKSYFGLLHEIIQGELPHLPADAAVSDELRDLVRLCVRREPAERATAAQLRQHAWVRGARLWSPSKHSFFPRRARERAVRLLLLGHLLAADTDRFGPGAGALADIFPAHVLPHAVWQWQAAGTDSGSSGASL